MTEKTPWTARQVVTISDCDPERPRGMGLGAIAPHLNCRCCSEQVWFLAGHSLAAWRKKWISQFQCRCSRCDFRRTDGHLRQPGQPDPVQLRSSFQPRGDGVESRAAPHGERAQAHNSPAFSCHDNRHRNLGQATRQPSRSGLEGPKSKFANACFLRCGDVNTLAPQSATKQLRPDQQFSQLRVVMQVPILKQGPQEA